VAVRVVQAAATSTKLFVMVFMVMLL